MLRLVLIVLAVVAIALLVVRLVRDAGEAKLDWRGVALAVGFVMLAVYLRHTTDIGGLI